MGQTLPTNHSLRSFCGTSPGKVPAFFLDLARGRKGGTLPAGESKGLASRMLRTLPAGKGRDTTLRCEGGTAPAGGRERHYPPGSQNVGYFFAAEPEGPGQLGDCGLHSAIDIGQEADLALD